VTKRKGKQQVARGNKKEKRRIRRGKEKAARGKEKETRGLRRGKEIYHDH
jgi:hypothetical protein